MINVITVAGHLGSDPEKRKAGEKFVTSARLAVSQGKDKPTIWLDVQAWEGGWAAGDLARCSKGQRVTCTGQLQLREWTAQDGSARQSWGIRLDGIEGAPKPDPRDGDGPAEPVQRPARAPAGRQHERRVTAPPTDDWTPPRDEDLF